MADLVHETSTQASGIWMRPGRVNGAGVAGQAWD
jgi:hypothetical protein